MSIEVSNYECVCGGNITERWDNNNLLVKCDNNYCAPYPKELWNKINQDVMNGIKCNYKGTTYYCCDEIYYVEINKNSGKSIYESHFNEESVKKWIDDSFTQTIL